jgi:hypothetical protein
MAASKSQGTGLKKKVGPLPIWAYPVLGGGAFLIYRFIKSREASSAAAAGTATSGGTDIPAGQSTSSSTTLPTFSSLSDWEQAAISAMSSGTLSPADALNGLTDWINGQCVSADQFKGISQIISSVGLPPGFSTVPVLSVCGSATAANTTAPAPTPTAAPATATGAEGLSGSGYGVPGGIANILDYVLGNDGHSYQYVQSPAQLGALQSSGVTTFYQSAENVFTPITAQNSPSLATGTPVFTQVA